MKKNLHKLFFSMLFYSFTLGNLNGQSFSPQLSAMLQDTLNTYMSFISNIKGMSASIYLPGQGVWQGTAGVSYAGNPIQQDMVFGIASNTKLFVAAAMLKLQEENILSLNDSLHQWLPNFNNINPNITIRQLLNHTSGVQDPIFLAPWMDTIMLHPTRIFTPEEVLSWVGPPVFPAGTSWGYSNINYILAGMVAKSATGQHISQIIRTRIIEPLNLNHTFYDVEEEEIGIVPHRWFNSIDYNDTSRVGLNTAGGCAGALFSSSNDIVSWFNALMTGQVLNSNSFAQLTNFIPTTAGYNYGLGLENQVFFGRNTYGHGGTTWGYKSRTVYDPCMGVAVCGLVNSWPAGSDGLTLILYRVIINHVPSCPSPINGQSTVCKGQNSVVYNVSQIPNATSYIWTLPNGATGVSSTNTITVDYGTNAVSGNITVRGNSIYGVGQIATIPISINNLNTSVSIFDNIISADDIADSYQWLDCGNNYENILGETNQAIVLNTGGNFAVEINQDGCKDTSNCVFFTTVGTNNLSSFDNEISIFPNPGSSELNLNILNGIDFTVEFINLLGQTILIKEKSNKIDISNLTAGSYFLKFKQEKKICVKRFTKE